MLTNDQKKSLLVGLQYYEKLDKKYYILSELKIGKPYLFCPYWYCRKRKMKASDVLPFCSTVWASDEKPGTFNIAFEHKIHGTLLAMRNVPQEYIKDYVDDLYGATQRMVITEYDGRNHPTTLKQEINRIKMWEDDKFKFAKIEYFKDVIDEVQENEYKVYYNS